MTIRGIGRPHGVVHGLLFVCSLLFTPRTVLITIKPTNNHDSFRYDEPLLATNITFSQQQQQQSSTDTNDHWWLIRTVNQNLSHPHIGTSSMVVNSSITRLVRPSNLNQSEQTSDGSAIDQIWLGHSLDTDATTSNREPQHPRLTVVMTYCKGPLDWLPPFIGDHQISSFTIVSKCGRNPEIPKLQVEVEVQNMSNVGGCDHTMAHWMGKDLYMNENKEFGDKDLVLFLKDNLYIHQPGQQRRTLAEMVSIATSSRGFGCFLEPADGKSILHKTNVLGQFNMSSYNGTHDGFKSPKHSNFQDWQMDMNITLPNPLVHVCYGGTCIVKKSHIATLPRSLYKSIEESLSRGDKIEEAHFAERSWAGLLSKPLGQKEVDAVYQSVFDVWPAGRKPSYTGTLMRKAALGS